MANRRYDQFQYSLEHKVVSLWAYVSIGATGAPTLTAAKSKGIASIARNSAGKYTVTLQDSYQYLMGFNEAIVLASGVTATASSSQAVVRADNSASATPTVVIEHLDNAGVAIELVSGAKLLIKFELKNSTV